MFCYTFYPRSKNIIIFVKKFKKIVYGFFHRVWRRCKLILKAILLLRMQVVPTLYYFGSDIPRRDIWWYRDGEGKSCFTV